jgi:hypothetical protein
MVKRTFGVIQLILRPDGNIAHQLDIKRNQVQVKRNALVRNVMATEVSSIIPSRAQNAKNGLSILLIKSRGLLLNSQIQVLSRTTAEIQVMPQLSGAILKTQRRDGNTVLQTLSQKVLVKKNAQARGAQVTEAGKTRQGLEKHACCGILRIHTSININQALIQMPVLTRTIAEIQVIMKVFGAIPLTKIRDGRTVIQLPEQVPLQKPLSQNSHMLRDK